MTDLAPTPIDLTKARAIAAMLDSSHDGEVVNAARALCRLAKAAGLKVDALIGGGGPQRSEAVSDDLRTRSTETYRRAAEVDEAFRQGMSTDVHVKSRGLNDLKDAIAEMKAALDDDYRAAFSRMLAKVQMKTVGTKLLSDEERVLIFGMLPGLRPEWLTRHNVESLLSIARRLGIV